jgi:hypothetical protein
MNTEQQATPEVKPKMGRPKKEKTGKNVYIPADILDTVLLMIQVSKQQHNQRQAKQ